MKGNTYEPPVRIELTTCALQVRCSTTELERPALQVSSNTAGAIMAVKSQILKSKPDTPPNDRLAQ